MQKVYFKVANWKGVKPGKAISDNRDSLDSHVQRVCECKREIECLCVCVRERERERIEVLFNDFKTCDLDKLTKVSF
jgi:hypothetical protein